MSKGISRYPLPRHHYNLPKFRSTSDPAWAVVKDTLGPLVKGARSFLQSSHFDSHTQDILGRHSATNRDSLLVQRKLLHDSLAFSYIDARRSTIQMAYDRTCAWFQELEQYRIWLKPKEDPRYKGFLWIKGKAGAGKSTLVKYLFDSFLLVLVNKRLQPLLFFPTLEARSSRNRH